MLGLAARLLGGMVTPLIDQVSASSARLLKKLALFAVAGLSLVVVLIALTLAFELWVASKAGHIAGTLAVAGLYLAVAVVCVVVALRGGRTRETDGARAPKGQAETHDGSQIDDFAAPLLAVLQQLGLKRELLAVLAGTSVAKQLGPIPLVGLAIVAGFLIGRMSGGLRKLFGGEAGDVLASLFGGPRGDDGD